MAAVSVISKHMAPGAEIAVGQFGDQVLEEALVVQEVPDRLTAIVYGLIAEPLRCTTRSSAWRTTQRSMEGMTL